MDGAIRSQNPSTTAFRHGLVSGLDGGTETRATDLRKLAENAEVRRNELNLAFVMAEYFGYLRRNPDTGGLNLWLISLIARQYLTFSKENRWPSESH
jgi:hypothetical protein